MASRRMSLLVWGALVLLPAQSGWGQYSQVTTPMHSVQHSFFERIGIGWGFRMGGPRGHVFFNNGGANSALPPFGGYNPAADARLGFGGRRGNAGFFFNLAASQGSSRTMVMQAPTVMVPHGGTGMISDTMVRPFVMGMVPVVGQWQVSPLQERLERLNQPGADQSAAGSPAAERPAEAAVEFGRPVAPVGGPVAAVSSASRGDLSVAEIRRQLAAQDLAAQQEVEALVQRGRQAELAGKKGVAQIFYQQAANRTDGELKDQLLEQIRMLKRPVAGTAESPRGG